MVADFTGEWISSYMYHNGESGSQHIVTFKGDADLTGESHPQQDGSRLFFRLTFDASTNTLTGTWRELTSPTGAYEGKEFHGALQMIVNPAGNSATGVWVGFNSHATAINTGSWTLERKAN